jgi:hypothetical protein
MGTTTAVLDNLPRYRWLLGTGIDLIAAIKTIFVPNNHSGAEIPPHFRVGYCSTIAAPSCCAGLLHNGGLQPKWTAAAYRPVGRPRRALKGADAAGRMRASVRVVRPRCSSSSLH